MSNSTKIGLTNLNLVSTGDVQSVDVENKENAQLKSQPNSISKPEVSDVFTTELSDRANIVETNLQESLAKKTDEVTTASEKVLADQSEIGESQSDSTTEKNGSVILSKEDILESLDEEQREFFENFPSERQDYIVRSFNQILKFFIVLGINPKELPSEDEEKKFIVQSVFQTIVIFYKKNFPNKSGAAPVDQSETKRAMRESLDERQRALFDKFPPEMQDYTVWILVKMLELFNNGDIGNIPPEELQIVFQRLFDDIVFKRLFDDIVFKRLFDDKDITLADQSEIGESQSDSTTEKNGSVILSKEDILESLDEEQREFFENFPSERQDYIVRSFNQILKFFIVLGINPKELLSEDEEKKIIVQFVFQTIVIFYKKNFPDKSGATSADQSEIEESQPDSATKEAQSTVFSKNELNEEKESRVKKSPIWSEVTSADQSEIEESQPDSATKEAQSTVFSKNELNEEKESRVKKSPTWSEVTSADQSEIEESQSDSTTKVEDHSPKQNDSMFQKVKHFCSSTYNMFLDFAAKIKNKIFG